MKSQEMKSFEFWRFLLIKGQSWLSDFLKFTFYKKFQEIFYALSADYSQIY